MKLYAPSYYRDFVCIADKCRHSCCVGWEIDIDEDALDLYQRLEEPWGTRIRQSICTEGTPHFCLSAEERCPHLAQNGLCHIISDLGEGYLCHICREHPRFYNDTAKGREVGLGMCCEEACRLILAAKDYTTLYPVGELPDEERPDFDAVALRAEVLAILSDASLPYTERLARIGSAFGVSPDRVGDDAWRGLLASLEYMSEESRALFGCYSSSAKAPLEMQKPLERALAYFIYRHCTPARDGAEFAAALGMCLLCERLLASVLQQGTLPLHEAARLISEELEYSEDNTDALKAAFA